MKRWNKGSELRITQRLSLLYYLLPNYKSTRKRIDSKSLYGRWRLHLMGSCHVACAQPNPSPEELFFPRGGGGFTQALDRATIFFGSRSVLQAILSNKSMFYLLIVTFIGPGFHRERPRTLSSLSTGFYRHAHFWHDYPRWGLGFYCLGLYTC